jgi:hypothetical protein
LRELAKVWNIWGNTTPCQTLDHQAIKQAFHQQRYALIMVVYSHSFKLIAFWLQVDLVEPNVFDQLYNSDRIVNIA